MREKAVEAKRAKEGGSKITSLFEHPSIPLRQRDESVRIAGRLVRGEVK